MSEKESDSGRVSPTRRTFMQGTGATGLLGMSGWANAQQGMAGEGEDPPDPSSQDFDPRAFADTIVLNGTIVTVDDDEHNQEPGTIASGMAIRDGRIVDVVEDDSERINRWSGPDTQVIDAGEKTVLPGIVESHVHPSHLLRGEQVLIAPGLHVGVLSEGDPEATLEKLRDVVEDLEPQEDEWVLLELYPNEDEGVSLSEQTNTWFKTATEEEQAITREDLTEMMPDNPMALGSGTGPTIADPGEIIRVDEQGEQEVLQNGGEN